MEKDVSLADRIARSPLTRTKIAKAVGVSRTTLWRWECGDPIEKIDQVARLAEVLRCRPTDLSDVLRSRKRSGIPG